MNRIIVAFGLLAAASVSTACVPHIHDTFFVDGEGGATLDALQRVVLVTRHGGPGRDRTVVCAEPSPDTMSAIASAVALHGGNGQVEAGLNTALSQTAASIGIRTPTIQLLRDGRYRACEGYLNGVLDQAAYELILRNYDRVMVSMLALDAAAGTPRAPNLVISGGDVQIQDSAGGGSSPTQSPAADKTGGSGASAGADAKGGGKSPPAILITKKTDGSPNTVTGSSASGIDHADQVMKAVTDSMLDNNKWYTAVCLTALDQIIKAKPDDNSVNPYKSRALDILMTDCDAVIRNTRLGPARQFAGDAPPAKMAGASGPARTKKATVAAALAVNE